MNSTTSTSTVVPFRFESQEIRVIQDETGSPWWVAKDVCEVLGIQWKGSESLSCLDGDESGKTGVIDSLGREQEVLIISESGLYALIIRSNKPEARPFRKWITSEVLPAIRKTGSYAIPGDQRWKDGLDRLARCSSALNSLARIIRKSDSELSGEASLRALNYFTGMPVDDMIAELQARRALAEHTAKTGRPLSLQGVFGAFVDECCRVASDNEIGATPLYKAFSAWYAQKFENGGCRPKSGSDIGPGCCLSAKSAPGCTGTWVWP